MGGISLPNTPSPLLSSSSGCTWVVARQSSWQSPVLLWARFAFVSKGPLGALRIIPRRLHVYLDLVLAAGFAVSPLLYLHDLQIVPIILSEAIAVLLVRMSLTTEIVPRPRAGRRAASW